MPRPLLSIRESLATPSLYPFVLAALAETPRSQRAAIRILDLPAGRGVTSEPLAAAGFSVTPADLFPERLAAPETDGVVAAFQRRTGVRMAATLRRALFDDDSTDPPTPRLTPVAADMEARLPFEDASFDVVLCVEGIEHVRDRHRTLEEFRRVLKPRGRLLLTTPNLLSLRARLAFALAGQRALRSFIDEYTSVWGVSDDGARTYHGHAFLVSYYQLRYSLRHCGFTIDRLPRSNWSTTSLALSPFIPLIALGTRSAQRRAERKFARMRSEGRVDAAAPAPHAEMLRHVLSPAMLYNATLIIEARAADRAPLVHPAASSSSSSPPQVSHRSMNTPVSQT